MKLVFRLRSIFAAEIYRITPRLTVSMSSLVFQISSSQRLGPPPLFELTAAAYRLHLSAPKSTFHCLSWTMQFIFVP